MGPADADLLARIARGDADAVGALYDRYVAVLFPMALRILRVHAEAEDVLHDAFVTVSERAAQYSVERGSVAAWLVTLVRNLSIDRKRRRDRRGSLARKDAQERPTFEGRTPETLAADADRRARVRAGLASLPEAQRKTLEVAFYEGLSYPEIAEREGVPLGTVKSRAARAIAALRDALVAAEADEPRGAQRTGPRIAGGGRVAGGAPDGGAPTS